MSVNAWRKQRNWVKEEGDQKATTEALVNHARVGRLRSLWEVGHCRELVYDRRCPLNLILSELWVDLLRDRVGARSEWGRDSSTMKQVSTPVGSNLGEGEGDGKPKVMHDAVLAFGLWFLLGPAVGLRKLGLLGSTIRRILRIDYIYRKLGWPYFGPILLTTVSIIYYTNICMNTLRCLKCWFKRSLRCYLMWACLVLYCSSLLYFQERVLERIKYQT